MTTAILPKIIAEATVGYTAQPITSGMSGASVLRLLHPSAPPLFLKIIRDRLDLNGRHEYERLRWLTNKVLVPEVRAFVEQSGVSYLLLSAVPGIDASNDVYRANLVRLTQLLAQGLQMLHAVPMIDCPFDHTTGSMLAQARWRVEQGLVNESEFDPQRQGHSAAALFAELVARRPPNDDLVFTHGDYCLPNILIDGDAISGFVDVGRAGVGDRYRDLALVARSLTFNGYPQYVPLLFAEYGIEPDEQKIAFFQFVDEFF